MNCLRARSRVALLCLLLAFSIAGPGSFKSLPTGPRIGDTWVRPVDGMVMVYVPGGEFEMGTTEAGLRYARELCKEACGAFAIAVCQASAFADEEPAHRVTLDGFWIDRTEVANGQYERCVEAGACTPPTETGSYTRVRYYGEPAYADYPVVWVTWEQAAEYAAWVGARLPTEAEWEYAARSPESRIFPWGDTFDGTRLNYCDAACAAGPKDLTVFDGFADTAPVGSFPAGVSWCGALDLAGNVREWVADGYGPYAAGSQSNPRGPEAGEAYVPKGGSWLDRSDDVRGANRGANAPDYSEHKVGFRCALDAVP